MGGRGFLERALSRPGQGEWAVGRGRCLCARAIRRLPGAQPAGWLASMALTCTLDSVWPRGAETPAAGAARKQRWPRWDQTPLCLSPEPCHRAQAPGTQSPAPPPPTPSRGPCAHERRRNKAWVAERRSAQGAVPPLPCKMGCQHCHSGRGDALAGQAHEGSFLGPVAPGAAPSGERLGAACRLTEGLEALASGKQVLWRCGQQAEAWRTAGVPAVLGPGPAAAP